MREKDTYTGTSSLTGVAYSTDTSKYDVYKNIYDLTGNLREWTMEAANDYGRTPRVGSFHIPYVIAYRNGNNDPVLVYGGDYGARVALYVK